VKTCRAISAVFCFEWKKSLTVARIAWWIALAAFAPVLVLLIQFTVPDEVEAAFWSGFLYVMIPCVVSMMGVFLWATPAIATELENRSWTYLAVRPQGPIAIVVGKFLVAISWTVLAAWLGLTASLLLIFPEQGMRIWFVLAILSLLSCISYAGIFSLIGVMFPKRGMVIAVAYSLVIEVLLAFIPAMINRLTLQLRLRSLLVTWMEWEENFATIGGSSGPGPATMIYNEAPVWWHLSVLAVVTIGALGLSILVLRWREFGTAGDNAF
jgi:ABC-type transport system involved in multi-copper enzyme maturation permease subunit